MGDLDRLIQVFINLIANGIKYNISPDPVFRISSTRCGDDYAVVV
jgi:signal transduction histidine kinase